MVFLKNAWIYRISTKNKFNPISNNFLYFVQNQFSLNEIQTFFIFYRTALILAVEKGNLEIVKILLECPGIDVNMKSISIIF